MQPERPRRRCSLARVLVGVVIFALVAFVATHGWLQSLQDVEREVEQRGRCIAHRGLCECFPPYRGEMCTVVDAGSGLDTARPYRAVMHNGKKEMRTPPVGRNRCRERIFFLSWFFLV